MRIIALRSVEVMVVLIRFRCRVALRFHGYCEDGEKLLHAEESVPMYKKWGIRVLKDWPPYSADLNPQENVWGWAEPVLRKAEVDSDTLQIFKKPCPHRISYVVVLLHICWHGRGPKEHSAILSLHVICIAT